MKPAGGHSPVWRARLACAVGVAGAVLALWGGAGRGQELRSRRYYIRIALARGARQVVIRPSGAYRVVGPKGGTGEALRIGQTYIAEVSRGKIGTKVYRLSFKEFELEETKRAEESADKIAKDYGLKAEVIHTPATQGKEPRLLVVAGEFPTRQDALTRGGKIKPSSIWKIYEEQRGGSVAGLTLRDTQGKVLASDDSVLRLDPGDPELSAAQVMKADSGGGAPGAISGSRAYHGQIDLHADSEGGITAVNNLWLEYYLYGVVAAEMGDTAPLEALKAQAVVARSEIVAQIEQKSSAQGLFDFDVNALDRAYHGTDNETAQIRQAVDSTRGEILIYNGEPIQTHYSHSCGGVLATPQDIWDVPFKGYFRCVADRLKENKLPDLTQEENAREWIMKGTLAFCSPAQTGASESEDKNYRWVVSFTGDKVTELVNRAYGTGRVKDIQVIRRTPSGRIRMLKIVGEKKTAMIDRELTIRDLFGGLKSSFAIFKLNYDAKKSVSSLTIYGAGYGHGVGLCQVGSMSMARQNYTYRQILGHYFSQVMIRRLYA